MSPSARPLRAIARPLDALVRIAAAAAAITSFSSFIQFGVGVARAQPATPGHFAVSNRPTRGLEVPAGPIVGTATATALELNPGQLGLTEHLSLDFLGNSLPDGATWSGRGAGLFLALPVSSFALGGALQWITPPGDSQTHVKSQLGLAVAGSDRFGLGLVWNHFFADDNPTDPTLKGLDSFDLGLSLRPWRFVGLGVAVRDVFRPDVAGPVGLQRVFETELALRPRGTDRLEVAGRIGVGATRATTSYGGRFSAELFRGVRILGLVESIAVDGFLAGTGFPAGGAFAAGTRDLRATLALAVDMNHSGVTGAGYASRLNRAAPPGGDRESMGYGVLVSLRGEESPSVIPDRYIERIELGDVSDENDFLSLSVHLHRLAADPDVRGVLFDLDNVSLGLGLLEELRDEISILRAHGKKTYAYFTETGTRGYYLAAACDRIYAQPASTLALNGLGRGTTFYKEGLDRLGVSVELVRIDEYKGAMEPFVRTSYSDPVRENLRGLIDGAADRIVAAIAKGRRRLAVPEIKVLMNKALFTAREAQQAGLIDEISHRGELTSIDEHTVKDREDGPRKQRAWARPQVAVVVVPGPIVDGESESVPLYAGETAGSKTVVKNLKDAASDDSVRAVVLRINSPGGSVSASEDIARAVKKVREAGKPVIVSMGDVAASGGYYIAAPADRIFAQPSTLTGSIGIYAFHVDAEILMQSLGLHVETQETAEHALAMSPHRPWTEEEHEIMRGHIRQLYDLFLKTVAEGRQSHDKSITTERVNELGRGFVHSGENARRHHLVDGHGGFLAAVQAAAKTARVPTDDAGLPALKIYSNVEGPLFQLAVRPAGISAESPLAKLLVRALGRVGQETIKMLMPILTAGSGQALAVAPFLWQPD